MPAPRRACVVLAFTLVLAFAAAAQQTYDAALAAGMKAYSEGNLGEAEKHFKNALKDLERSNPDDSRIGMLLSNLAIVKKAQGLDREVEPLLKRAIAVFEKSVGPDHPDLATSLENLGLFYYDQLLAKAGKTRSDIRSAYAAFGATGRLSALAPRAGAGAQVTDQLARAHQKAAKEDPEVVYSNQAEDCLKRALAIREKHFGPESAELVPSLKDLGELYIVTERFKEAEAALLRAYSIREKTAGAEDADAAAVMNMLASVYRNQKHYTEAQMLYDRALAIQEKTLGPEHADLAPTLQAYAVLLKETGKKDEAKAMESRAKAIQKKNKP